MTLKRIASSLAAALFIAAGAGNVQAEVSHLTVARQYGVSYLPLIVMQHDKLIQKQAARLGVAHLKVRWYRFAGGNVMNDALLSGSLQFASGGVGPLVKIWAKTRGNLNVRGVSALNMMPLFLNTTDPKVKSVKDFSSRDRIALPAVKVSIQAVTLEMAAAKAFGFEHYARLDKYTVSMSHPDGMQAMLSGHSEIDAHFTSPPYQYKELEDPRVHTVLTSYQVLGGPATFNVVWTTQRFREENPKVYQAFTRALAQAIGWINAHKRAAARLYIEATHSTDSVDFIYKIITSPEVHYTMTPKHTMKYANFLYKVGAIKVKPKSWKQMFFPNVAGLPGG